MFKQGTLESSYLFGRISSKVSIINYLIVLILYILVGMYMQKYISLLSTVQSQPTHTPSTRNQATGFSFK
jgi:hypothetical protein